MQPGRADTHHHNLIAALTATAMHWLLLLQARHPVGADPTVRHRHVETLGHSMQYASGWSYPIDALRCIAPMNPSFSDIDRDFAAKTVSQSRIFCDCKTNCLLVSLETGKSQFLGNLGTER